MFKSIYCEIPSMKNLILGGKRSENIMRTIIVSLSEP